MERLLYSHNQLHLLEQLPLSLCTYPLFHFLNLCFQKTGFGSGLPPFINSGVSLNLKVFTWRVSIPRPNLIKSVASTNFAISPSFCVRFKFHCDVVYFFLSFILNSLNSLDTVPYSYLEKVFSFISYLFSRVKPYLDLIQSTMIVLVLYLQFNIDGYILGIYLPVTFSM